MIQVLLVDDHHLVRAGIRNLLESVDHINVAGEASSGEEALALTERLHIDVAVLDIRMPGMTVEELIKKLYETSPHTRCIILTSADEELLSTRLLEQGVFAYVTKASDSEHLLEAITKAAKSERYISPDIAKRLAVKVLHQKEDLSANASPFQDLSSREMECLLLMAKGKSIKEIAEILKIHSKTINTYRYRIFNKLHIANDIELIKLVTRYQLTDETS